MGLLLASMWCAGFFMWKDPSIDSTPPIELPMTSIPECGENNWTAGNAFYTITAICFCYYAYPRGSLIASPSGRTWRLSSILALEELVLGIVLFLIARRNGVKLTIFCHAVIAYRLSNGFNSGTLQEELDLTVARPPRNDDTEIYRVFKELKEQVNAGNALLPKDLTPTQDMFMWSEARKKVSDRRQEYNIHLFTQILLGLRRSENGPSYRIFVWLPMTLQIIKLICVITVSQQISWLVCLVYLVAFVYFFAWLVVELTMLQVSRHRLSDEELKNAAELCHTWKSDLKEWIGEDSFKAVGADVNAFAIPSLFLISAVNLGLTAKLFYDLGTPKFESFWLAVLVVWCLFIAGVWILYLFTRPLIMIIFLGIIKKTWMATGGEAKLGKLWSEVPVEDDACLYTASAALYGACLFVFALAGVGPWKGAFHCWEVQIPPFYDWLG